MHWQQEKAAALLGARCVVVKVGSAVLTTAAGIDRAVITDLAAQLAALRLLPDGGQRRVVLVSSGAVAAGRAALAGCAAEIASMAARQGAAAVGQGRLMHEYDSAFAAHNVPIAQVLLTRDDLRSRQRFLNARNTFAQLLHWGVIPIVNENDTVSTSELKFGDNDCLASLLVNLVEAELYINLTSAGGVFAANPETQTNPPIMPCIEAVRDLDLDSLCGGKTTVGTGGMYSKLMAARRAAQLGVPTLILSGKTRGIISAAVQQASTGEGEALGTWVRPEAHSISRRKFWLAYQSEPAGTVRVDSGAARALHDQGSSLLPVGVVAVEGNFQSGALVRIVHEGKSLGVGLSNYAAADLKKIMGLKRIEVAAILGDAHYPEVIHRDHLLVDAAI